MSISFHYQHSFFSTSILVIKSSNRQSWNHQSGHMLPLRFHCAMLDCRRRHVPGLCKTTANWGVLSQKLFLLFTLNHYYLLLTHHYSSLLTLNHFLLMCPVLLSVIYQLFLCIVFSPPFFFWTSDLDPVSTFYASIASVSHH